MSTIKNLHFKWTISKGRDTYGYNICTLLVDGMKKGKCLGGGYDMQGTSFAQWLQNDYQQILVNRFAKEIAEVTPADYTQYSGNCYKPISEFYGARISGKEGKPLHIELDGGCGMESMKRIAEAIGIKLQWNKESDRYKNHTFYTAIIN